MGEGLDLSGLEREIAALATETTDGFAGAVRVDTGTTTRLRAAYGLADRARGLPMTVDTRLAVARGSVTTSTRTIPTSTSATT